MKDRWWCRFLTVETACPNPNHSTSSRLSLLRQVGFLDRYIWPIRFTRQPGFTFIYYSLGADWRTIFIYRCHGHSFSEREPLTALVTELDWYFGNVYAILILLPFVNRWSYVNFSLEKYHLSCLRARRIYSERKLHWGILSQWLFVLPKSSYDLYRLLIHSPISRCVNLLLSAKFKTHLEEVNQWIRVRLVEAAPTLLWVVPASAQYSAILSHNPLE